MTEHNQIHLQQQLQLQQAENQHQQQQLQQQQQHQFYKHQDTRTHVVGELYDTERSYVESLQILTEKYMKPLKSAESNKANLIDPNLVDEIFYTIPEILQHHENFLSALQDRLSSDWDSSQVIGNVFIEAFTNQQIIDIYTAFINNWKNARHAIKVAIQEKPAFERFLETMSREHKNKLTLDALLIMPVQRIPRYELLIKELIKHTPIDHPDHGPLIEAQREIHELAIKIDQAEKEMVHQEQLRDLESLIEGHVELQHPQRDFIRYDLVTISASTLTVAKKERVLFLFCDLLIMTSVKKKVSRRSNLQAAFANSSNDISLLEGNKFKLLIRVSLDQIDIRHNEAALAAATATTTTIDNQTTQLHQQQQQLNILMQQQQQEKCLQDDRRRTLEADMCILQQIEHLSSRLSMVDGRRLNQVVDELTSQSRQVISCLDQQANKTQQKQAQILDICHQQHPQIAAPHLNAAASTISIQPQSANDNLYVIQSISPTGPCQTGRPASATTPMQGIVSLDDNLSSLRTPISDHSIISGSESLNTGQDHNQSPNHTTTINIAATRHKLEQSSILNSIQQAQESDTSLEFIISSSNNNQNSQPDSNTTLTSSNVNANDLVFMGNADVTSHDNKATISSEMQAGGNMQQHHHHPTLSPASKTTSTATTTTTTTTINSCETLVVTFSSIDRRQAFLQAFLEAKKQRNIQIHQQQRHNHHKSQIFSSSLTLRLSQPNSPSKRDYRRTKLQHQDEISDGQRSSSSSYLIMDSKSNNNNNNSINIYNNASKQPIEPGPGNVACNMPFQQVPNANNTCDVNVNYVPANCQSFGTLSKLKSGASSAATIGSNFNIDYLKSPATKCSHSASQTSLSCNFCNAQNNIRGPNNGTTGANKSDLGENLHHKPHHHHHYQLIHQPASQPALLNTFCCADRHNDSSETATKSGPRRTTSDNNGGINHQSSLCDLDTTSLEFAKSGCLVKPSSDERDPQQMQCTNHSDHLCHQGTSQDPVELMTGNLATKCIIIKDNNDQHQVTSSKTSPANNTAEEPQLQAPRFLFGLPTTSFLSTQHPALQFTCSTPKYSCSLADNLHSNCNNNNNNSSNNNSSKQQTIQDTSGKLWLCMSNGYVSHIALISFRRRLIKAQAGDRHCIIPVIHSAGDICKSRINCVAQVKWASIKSTRYPIKSTSCKIDTDDQQKQHESGINKLNVELGSNSDDNQAARTDQLGKLSEVELTIKSASPPVDIITTATRAGRNSPIDNANNNPATTTTTSLGASNVQDTRDQNTNQKHHLSESAPTTSSSPCQDEYGSNLSGLAKNDPKINLSATHLSIPSAKLTTTGAARQQQQQVASSSSSSCRRHHFHSHDHLRCRTGTTSTTAGNTICENNHNTNPSIGPALRRAHYHHNHNHNHHHHLHYHHQANRGHCSNHHNQQQHHHHHHHHPHSHHHGHYRLESHQNSQPNQIQRHLHHHNHNHNNDNHHLHHSYANRHATVPLADLRQALNNKTTKTLNRGDKDLASHQYLTSVSDKGPPNNSALHLLGGVDETSKQQYHHLAPPPANTPTSLRGLSLGSQDSIGPRLGSAAAAAGDGTGSGSDSPIKGKKARSATPPARFGSGSGTGMGNAQHKSLRSARMLRHQASLKTSSILAKLVSGATRGSSYLTSRKPVSPSSSQQQPRPLTKQSSDASPEDTEPESATTTTRDDGQKQSVLTRDGRCQMMIRRLDNCPSSDSDNLIVPGAGNVSQRLKSLDRGDSLNLSSSSIGTPIISPLSSASSLNSTTTQGSSLTVNSACGSSLNKSQCSIQDNRQHQWLSTNCCVMQSSGLYNQHQCEITNDGQSPETDDAGSTVCTGVRSRSATVPCRAFCHKSSIDIQVDQVGTATNVARETNSSAYVGRANAYKVSELINELADSDDREHVEKIDNEKCTNNDIAAAHSDNKSRTSLWLGCDNGTLIVINCLIGGQTDADEGAQMQGFKSSSSSVNGDNTGLGKDILQNCAYCTPDLVTNTSNVSDCGNVHAEIKLPAPINDIQVHEDKTVFVAMANGQLAIFNRVANETEDPHNDVTSQWSLQSPQIVTVASNELSSTSKLCIINDTCLWYSYGRNIFVLDIATLNLQTTIMTPMDSIQSHPMQSITIDNMQLVDNLNGVWVTFKCSPLIQFFDISNYKLLLEMSLVEPINRILSYGNEIIRHHKTACLQATSLLNVYNTPSGRGKSSILRKDSSSYNNTVDDDDCNLLFIGTSAGIIIYLTIRRKELDQSTDTQNKTLWNPKFVSLRHGHSGQVKFLHLIELDDDKYDDEDVELDGGVNTCRNGDGRDIKKAQNSGTLCLISGGAGIDLHGPQDNEQQGVQNLNESEDCVNYLMLYKL